MRQRNLYSNDKLNRAIGEYYNGTKKVIAVTELMNVCQKVHGHIEACHITAALSTNILEIRCVKFDSHHSQDVKEVPQRSARAQNCCVVIQRMHERNGPCVFVCSKILTLRVE